MFQIFLWLTLLVVVICSAFTFISLYQNIDSAKKSAVDSVCTTAERIAIDHMDAIASAESMLHADRDIQVFLNEKYGDEAEVLKVNAAESIRTTVNYRNSGLGVALFYNDGQYALLTNDAQSDESTFLEEAYQRYRNEPDNPWFMYQPKDSRYPEFYVCHFTPVIYHSLEVVDYYEVGTMAVFSKINIYEIKNDVEKNSVIQVKLQNKTTDESVMLIDTAGERPGKGTISQRRIDHTDWYISAELFEIVGVNLFSPFVILTISLLAVLLVYVLLLRRSIRVLVDTPVKRISAYLEEFMLSKTRRTALDTVGVEEFDDILGYINALFERVTEQSDVIVKTQQEVYEKELLASERTLYMNQLQINPHFLFNTLNTITQMCQAEGLDNVTVITHSVADIFRYSIEGDYKATLDEEIYIVMKYLKIFESRYGREFPCELDVEDELYEFEVMKMTLQPLVENAFKHGGLANVENPLIKVSAYREGEDTVISVFDNGNGMAADMLRLVNHNLHEGNTKKNRGIGLLNVNRRLKICYGEQSGLEVESKLGEYTKIIIRIKEETKTETTKDETE